MSSCLWPLGTTGRIGEQTNIISQKQDGQQGHHSLETLQQLKLIKKEARQEGTAGHPCLMPIPQARLLGHHGRGHKIDLLHTLNAGRTELFLKHPNAQGCPMGTVV